MLTDAAIAALTKAGDEAFAFFPPVRGFEQNRWRFRDATRIEFCAANAATGEVVWFPRSLVSYMTIEGTGITVSLARELDYSDGAVWPARENRAEAQRREGALAPAAPLAVAAEAPQRPPEPPRPAAAGRQRRWFVEPMTLVLATAGGAAIALVLALVVARAWLQPPQRYDAEPITDTSLFTLAADDNYHDVVRKLGPPEKEQALTLASSDLQPRALVYTSRNYVVVVMGSEGPRSQPPRYIGAIRLSDGAVVASVSISHDTSTDSMLKLLARQIR